MKIGIITFHFAYNYGAMIQAYAMQEHLRMMGHEPYIIDYAPEYHTSYYSKGRTWKHCFSGKGLRIFWRIYLKLFRDPAGKRSKNFTRFMKKNFRLYPYDPNDDMSSFDCILLGSDQIWNQNITDNRFDGPYYGDGFKCRVFSYAASNRATELGDKEKDIYREKLTNLSFIGVREPRLQQLLQPLTDKHVYLNADPTILAGVSVYNKFDLRRPVVRKYVVVYETENHEEVQQMAKDYAKNLGASVIVLLENTDYRYGREYDQSASPEKFLAYIKNAECIFTSSFHGTVLSILFKKKFFSIRQGNSKDIRLESILEQVGLLDRFISMNANPIEGTIDYDLVDEHLTMMRTSSQQYLEWAIRGINEFEIARQ